MKFTKDIGIALGFLAGTTLGSGISFLFRFQPSHLMGTVAICGLAGVIAGLWTAAHGQQETKRS